MFKYLFIFALFSLVGFILEFIYKSITNKQIINPGLLTGPCVTIYGFGGVFLNIICSLIDSNYKIILIFIISSIVLTLLELITGRMILEIFNVKFWDYSNLKLNYKGLICIEFSFIWGILSILFYYFIYPWINNFTINIINNNIGLFLLGLYYGVFIIDLFVSINLLIKLFKYSRKINKVINAEKLKRKLLSNSCNIFNKLYPYIYINNFLKEEIKK